MTLPTLPTPPLERRLLQAAVAIASIVPLSAGAYGALTGTAMFDLAVPNGAADSHTRYLSGLLLGIGLAFLSLIPAIERQTAIFRTLGSIVIVGGLARAGGLLLGHVPPTPHVLALGMELGVVPALMAWQGRVARLWQHSGNMGKTPREPKFPPGVEPAHARTSLPQPELGVGTTCRRRA